MDNENTVLTEQEEDLETSGAFDEGWDEGWNEGFSADGQEPEETSEADQETEEESDGEEAEADQQEADTPEGEETTDGAESKETAEGKEGSSDQSDSYELKYLGESRTVNRDEVIKLAQQGMDYPRIREKWDGIKDDVPKLRMYEGFLKELAESRGGDIEALIDETRTRSLMAKAKAEGKELTASAAAAQAVQARMKAMEPEEAKQEKAREEERQAQRQASVARFMKLYPDIKGEDIPKKVWDDAEAMGDLTAAYIKYNSAKLSEENERLKKELEQAKQYKKNKERSMGSSKSVGATGAKDVMDEGWDEGWNG
jgi:hypothetical protein